MSELEAQPSQAPKPFILGEKGLEKEEDEEEQKWADSTLCSLGLWPKRGGEGRDSGLSSPKGAALFRQRSQGTRNHPCSPGHRPGGKCTESSAGKMKSDGRRRLPPETRATGPSAAASPAGLPDAAGDSVCMFRSFCAFAKGSGGGGLSRPRGSLPHDNLNPRHCSELRAGTQLDLNTTPPPQKKEKRKKKASFL